MYGLLLTLGLVGRQRVEPSAGGIRLRVGHAPHSQLLSPAGHAVVSNGKESDYAD